MTIRPFPARPWITARTTMRIFIVCTFLSCCLTAQAQEIISTPAVPGGPTSGVTGALYEFTASGSASNLGNPVQYSFNWGDGTNSGWTPNGVTMSFHAWSAPGTYTVTAQARSAVNTSAVSSVSPGLAVAIGGESISAPSAPAGPTFALTGTAGAYSTGSAVSSLGHTVQYMLFWGDGSNSGWLPAGTTSASHSWPGPGTFTVTAQARCAIDTQVLSPVSPGLSVVVVAGESTSTPTAPSGPTAATAGTSYTYSTGGAVTGSGNPVSYMFNWGDSTTSGWLPAGATSASHAWATGGTYTIAALAADSTDLLIQSHPSYGATVVVTVQAPSITSVSPASRTPGAQVTLSGSGFGSAQGQGPCGWVVPLVPW